MASQRASAAAEALALKRAVGDQADPETPTGGILGAVPDRSDGPLEPEPPADAPEEAMPAVEDGPVAEVGTETGNDAVAGEVAAGLAGTVDPEKAVAEVGTETLAGLAGPAPDEDGPVAEVGTETSAGPVLERFGDGVTSPAFIPPTVASPVTNPTPWADADSPSETAPDPDPAPSPDPAHVDVDRIIAEVGELHDHVFSEVEDDDVRGHLRASMQSFRLSLAVARAKGLWPARTLSLVCAVDADLTGRAQLFAGDRTAR